MNPELPPVELRKPQIKARRRAKSNNPNVESLSTEQRSAIAKRARGKLAVIRSATKSLSDEQRRAIFLKIKHDRPLEAKDFDGMGIALLGTPGESETFAVDRNEDNQFEKIQERIDLMAQASVEPKNRKFLESVTEFELGVPEDRLSEVFAGRVGELVTSDELQIYLIEISSQQIQQRSRSKEIENIRKEITTSIGFQGCIFDTDFQDDGAQMMVRTTGAKLKEFIYDDNWQRKITFFDLVPEFETFSQTVQDFDISKTEILPPPEGAETICIIDSGIGTGSPFLKPITKKEIGKSWVYNESPNEDPVGHGSGVASLAAYHTIDPSPDSTHQAAVWVTSARILDKDGCLDLPQCDDDNEDRLAQCKLLSTILREIVEHFTEHGVRVFVLSFQMRGQTWSLANRSNIPRNSWVARTIDQLSLEFDVVFCGITGNIDPQDVTDLIAEHEYPDYLDSPLAKILDPGQAALSLTAGSVAHSTKVVGGKTVPIAQEGMPSPFTRGGPGFGNSIKPDLIEFGGNYVFDSESQRISTNAGTNVLMASGKLTGVLAHDVGTSFAAPRIAYHLAIVLKELTELGVTPSACLLRAIMANSAIRDSVVQDLPKATALNTVGFGRPSFDRALTCENHSIILYWNGIMQPYQCALFPIYVPEGLTDVKGSKKLFHVSMAFAPPVQKWGVSNYLGVTGEYHLFRGDREPTDIEAMFQREDDEENVAGESVTKITSTLGSRARSKGCLQSDTFVWTQHKAEYSENEYTLAVALSKPAKWVKDKDLAVPISLVVRVEETSGVYSQLYNQVKTRVQVKV